jgi:pteridine reductase
MDLKNRHVFVTGSAMRLGRAIAESMLDAGAKLSAHSYKSAEEVKGLKQHAKDPKNVFSVKANLRNIKQVRSAVKKAVEHFGPVDILINCAGLFFPTPAFTVNESEWEELLEVNLKGPFFLSQAVAAGMRKGVIINFTDIYAKKPLRKYAAYSAAKAGLRMITRTLALEWAPKIRVNSISPGSLLLPESYGPGIASKIADRTLLKRIGTPKDAVEAVHFLIQNDYITGMDLVVDGGT